LTWRADLHVHSCLSPCGDLAASPRAIARAARLAGLRLVALTDHNTARNVPAFAEACRREGIEAVYGAEATTREEVHALVLFADPRTAWEAGEELYARLDAPCVDGPDANDQVYVDDGETVLGRLEKTLILGTTDFTLDGLGRWARGLGGILIPSHVDRPAFGVLGQLGFLPEGPFEAVEATRPLPRETTGPWPVICSSDAHHPASVGRRCIAVDAPAVGFDALREALAAGRVRPLFAP
jgi:PHP family Zn ribbon phosphoesterase